MFEGYLELGGSEVLNSARTVGYVSSSPCAVNWLVCPPCPGVNDALSEPTYDIGNISEAPWYDVEDEATHRFLGAYALSIEGIVDSTREASVAEGITDGGVVSQPRQATRSMRVRAMLSAEGEDALDAGLNWLDAALRPGRCGIHGTACGAADSRFFSACPPTQAEITMPEILWNDPATNLLTNPSFQTAAAAAAIHTNYAMNPAMLGTGAAVELARNYATNPSFETTSGVEEVRRNLAVNPAIAVTEAPQWLAGYFGVGGTGTAARLADLADGPLPQLNDYMRSTFTASPTSTTLYPYTFGRGSADDLPVIGGGTYTFSVYTRQVSAVTTPTIKLHLVFWTSAGALVSEVDGPTLTAPSGVWTRPTYTLAVPATAARVTVRAYYIYPAPPAPGATMDITGMLAEANPVLGAYFDGTTAPAGDFSYAWLGPVHNSASIQTGADPVGTAPTFCNAISSTEWASSGTRSCRIIPNNASTSSRSVIVAQRAVVAGEIYTVSAKFRLAAPLAGTLWGNALKLSVYFADTATLIYSTAVPNLAGVHAVTMTATVPVGDTKMDIRANVGATIGGGDLWVDDVIVTKGSTPFSYFDGATPAAPAQGLSYSWAGTANASESVMSGIDVSGLAVTTGRGFDYKVPEGAAVLFTSNSSQTEIGISRAGTTIPAAGQPATLLIRAKASQPISGTIRLGTTSGTTAPVTLTTAFQDFRITGVMGTVGTTVHLGFVLAGQPGDIVTIAHALTVAGDYPGPYFDGSTAAAGDFTYAWQAAVNGSASEQRALQVNQLASSAQAVSYLTTDAPYAGTRAARFELITAASAGIPVGDVTPVTGDTYTLIGRVRPNTRDQVFIPRIRSSQGAAFTAPMGEWTSFRVSVAAGGGAVNQTGLLLTAGAHRAGDLIDLDTVSLIAGDYSGGYFDGSMPDSEDPPQDYEWTGAVDGSTSTYRTGSWIEVPDPIRYNELVERLIRDLHNVTCVSGPLIEQKLHRGDAWGYIVEFTLVAAVPWVFSITRPISLVPSLPVVVQDVPFNLVPYPSAEIAGAATVVVATNYSTNPSVEVDATGWAAASSVVLPANVTGARSTLLASVGTASYRTRFVATNTSAVLGTIAAQNTSATFVATVAGQRMSANMWASATVESGTAVITKTEIFAIFYGGAVALRTDLIGQVAAAGGAVSLKGIDVPVGATSVVMQARTTLASWSTGAVVNLYADAVTISVP